MRTGRQKEQAVIVETPVVNSAGTAQEGCPKLRKPGNAHLRGRQLGILLMREVQIVLHSQLLQHVEISRVAFWFTIIVHVITKSAFQQEPGSEGFSILNCKVVSQALLSSRKALQNRRLIRRRTRVEI